MFVVTDSAFVVTHSSSSPTLAKQVDMVTVEPSSETLTCPRTTVEDAATYFTPSPSESSGYLKSDKSDSAAVETFPALDVPFLSSQSVDPI